MKQTHSVSFRATAALIGLLAALGQPAAVLAAVEDVTLVKVPPDTRIVLIGEERSDRVEARTKTDEPVVFQLKDRNWPSGQYILNIWEPGGALVSELITLGDGANRIDVSTYLGEPGTPAETAAKTGPDPAVVGGLAGAAAPSVVFGAGRRGAEEHRELEDDRRRGGRGASAGIAVGSALLGALAGSIFRGSSTPPPAPAAAATTQPPAGAASAAAAAALGFITDRVLATIPLADAAAMQALAQAIAADHNLALLAVNPLDSLNLGLAEYTIRDALDPPAKAAELAADARVESAQPEFIYQTTAKQEQLFYGRKLIRVDALPPSATGKGIRVALIDTGVDRARGELKNKIIESVDMTGKGFSADVHGTMLAGIIAAERASAIGVAPGVELLAIKSCQPLKPERIEGTCWSSTLARGIDFANTRSARAINLSVGGPQDPLLTRLVNEAFKRNIVVVAAAGNDGEKGRPRYPAALDGVIAVTAVDADQRLYRDATRGKFVAVAAPGVEIVSLGPGARLPISSGTSFAAAYVTGAIALLLEQRAAIAARDLQSVLEKAARDLGAPGKDEEFGSGLVDVCRTLEQLGPAESCR